MCFGSSPKGSKRDVSLRVEPFCQRLVPPDQPDFFEAQSAGCLTAALAEGFYDGARDSPWGTDGIERQDLVGVRAVLLPQIAFQRQSTSHRRYSGVVQPRPLDRVGPEELVTFSTGDLEFQTSTRVPGVFRFAVHATPDAGLNLVDFAPRRAILVLALGEDTTCLKGAVLVLGRYARRVGASHRPLLRCQQPLCRRGPLVKVDDEQPNRDPRPRTLS